MSRWRLDGMRRATVLGCDAHLLAGPATEVAAPAAGWNATALQTAFAALAAGPAVQVRVAPDLCRHFMLAAATGVRSLAELRELAALRAAQLFGGTADDWAVVADWRLDRSFACAALPQPLLQALCQAAADTARRLSVVSALLLAVERLLAGPSRSGFIGFGTPRHAVLVGLRAGRLTGLHAARHDETGDSGALSAQLMRDATRQALLGGGDSLVAITLAWPGPGPLPPAAWDAAGLLPAQQPADTEAAWARRLGLRGAP